MTSAKQLLFAAALSLAEIAVWLAPSEASACTISKISGTWEVHVTQISWDEYYYGHLEAGITSTVCRFRISRNSETVGSLRINCDGWGFFALDQRDFDFKPWHQLIRVGRRTRAAGSNRCQWRITDRNQLDAEYDVWFEEQGRNLMGLGAGFNDLHYGSTEPKFVTFNGLKRR